MHTAYSTAAILSLALGASAQALNATYATGLLTALKTSNLKYGPRPVLSLRT